MLLIKQKALFEKKKKVANRKWWYPGGIYCLYLTSISIVVRVEHTSNLAKDLSF